MEVEEAERGRASGGGGGGCSAAAGPDRLSSLPDCLLHTIMSFMKARQAVQTCVLSTRWRNLWRSVPCLDIDIAEFKAVPVSDNNSGSGGDDISASGGDDNSGSGGDDSSGSGGGGDDNSDSDSNSSESSESDLETSDLDEDTGPDSDGDSSDDDDDSSGSDSDDSSSDSERYIYGANNNSYVDNKRKEWEDFEDFTVNLMRQCNVAQLDSFRLHIVRSRAPRFGERQAAGWLRRAMKYCTLDRPRQHGGVSPGSWRLRSLHLCHVLLDSGFMERVSSVCRSLEDLELDDCSCQIQSVTSESLKTMVLKNCRWRNLSVIASPTLKTLVIDGGANAADSGLLILAPAVSYLNLAVKAYQFSGGVSIHEMPSLAKASIHIKDHGFSFPPSKLDGDQFKLLCSVSNVTSLELSGVGSTVLGKGPRFQKFKNLRNLILNKCDLSDDFHLLIFFLQSSPILEKLALRLCKFPKFPKKKKGTSSVHPGLDLLCENLKVEIIYKNGRRHHLIQLLLRISANLLENNIKLTKVD